MFVLVGCTSSEKSESEISKEKTSEKGEDKEENTVVASETFRVGNYTMKGEEGNIGIIYGENIRF
ncbi:hypothetical protein ACFFGV_09200 [Pontibacillus salicampi]|uniref:Uncharacterized protein n=1 Tax=Pontibacillus salicampi TaxID=1449801 RepID=A0ABV6LMX2_9BACI